MENICLDLKDRLPGLFEGTMREYSIKYGVEIEDIRDEDWEQCHIVFRDTFTDYIDSALEDAVMELSNQLTGTTTRAHEAIRRAFVNALKDKDML